MGASAALAGLLLVATSINLPRILEARYLVALAGQTLMILTGALCISSLALFPDMKPSSRIRGNCRVRGRTARQAVARRYRLRRDPRPGSESLQRLGAIGRDLTLSELVSHELFRAIDDGAAFVR